MLLAAIANKQDIKDFVGNALKVLWVDDLNIEDHEVMIAVADKSGLNGRLLYEQSNDVNIKNQIDSLTQEGVERQIFGTPFFSIRMSHFGGKIALKCWKS